ncbi:prepilin-type N-terminal cleavage/methylation domain-containing protein [Photobacterium japonica]|uniref:prepilin-type N-terminal cleavage/methylation domain-containing protein n=1 Tax=Photobacterium japonica TaxID=2910235 RepID=UPI003D1302A9
MPFKMKRNSGFTLVELLIGMSVSMILLMGVIMGYASIKGVIQSSKNIENAQEVLRFSTQTFTRSLKQARHVIIHHPGHLETKQAANTVACDGSRPTAAYTETYSHSGVHLQCDIGGHLQTILTGLQDIAFERTNNLVSITVTPQAQHGESAGIGAASPVKIDIALTGIILAKATGG